MTARHLSEALVARDEIVAAPVPRACQDRTFELPPALHLGVAALLLGFVGVLSFAFRNPGMAVPFGVFVAFIVAFFTVPALWARMLPKQNRSRHLSWAEFTQRGIDTQTGRETAVSATVLILLLPFLILGWAIAVATIAALV